MWFLANENLPTDQVHLYFTLPGIACFRASGKVAPRSSEIVDFRTTIC